MKKAYMLAALVVLLGASFLPAAAYPIHLFPQPFVKDGTIDYDFDGMPDVAIVLGSKAAPEDVLGATLIAAKMGSHLYFTNAAWVDAKHAEENGITLYHGSFSAQAYGQRYQALDLVGVWEAENEFKGFLWSWNWDTAPDPFGMIYPLFGDYVFVPASVKSKKSPTQIYYSVGKKFDTAALKEWVVFATSDADTYYPPAYNNLEETTYGVALTLDCPGTFTFMADAFDSRLNYTQDYVGSIIYTWSHAGFYFIHPLNPIDIEEGTKVDLPWLGYTLVAKTVDVDDAVGTYSVGFVAYKLGTTTPVDYFNIETIGTGVPRDDTPGSFNFYLYSVAHRDLYILADIDGDGVVKKDERLTTYFGITVRDVDARLDIVTMDFYSLILAPNIYPGYGESSVTTGDRAFDWDNTEWFFKSVYGWPHPPGSDYVDAADEDVGSMNVDVILEKSTYPDPAGPKVFAGGNMRLNYTAVAYPATVVTTFNDSKGYIVDTAKVFTQDKLKLAADESFLGISGYYNAYEDEDEWYVVVKSGTLGATLFVKDETGWYKPLNTDGKLVVGGEELWFTSVVKGVVTAYQECPALPPTVGAEYCGPQCGPTWGIYNFTNFTQGERLLTEVECESFVENDTLLGYESTSSCPKTLNQLAYADGEDEDVTTAVWHWQLNWFYPINATGVFAGIYDRVEDRNKDGVFKGATELVPITTPEGKTVYEDVTPDALKDLYFNFASPEEVYSFVRAPIAYMDTWVFDGKALSGDVKDKKLILVGGPLVNTLVKYLNDTGNLYILYRTDGKVTWLYNPLGAAGERDINLTYALSLIDPTIDPAYVYKIEGGNGLGVIQYAKSNPWNPDKEILVVAGTDRFGTLSASIALADPTKLANITISTFYNAGVGKVAPAVIVIGIRPTTVPAKVVIQPVLVVPVGLPSS
ncbi:MAG: S-layer protein [Candidatus Korarchaeum sp.]|nr:S-layer protein [Candidatus Korarchaeum sp.]